MMYLRLFLIRKCIKECGGPVDDGTHEDANHSGRCSDSSYGCTRCYDNANDGLGTLDYCEWCNKRKGYVKVKVHCKITKAWDEPVLYAICQSCRKKQESFLIEEEERDRLEHPESYPNDDYFDDDYNEEGIDQ